MGRGKLTNCTIKVSKDIWSTSISTLAYIIEDPCITLCYFMISILIRMDVSRRGPSAYAKKIVNIHSNSNFKSSAFFIFSRKLPSAIGDGKWTHSDWSNYRHLQRSDVGSRSRSVKQTCRRVSVWVDGTCFKWWLVASGPWFKAQSKNKFAILNKIIQLNLASVPKAQ